MNEFGTDINVGNITNSCAHENDLINRQQAIEKFEPWLKVKGYSEGELNVLKAVIYELRVMPPTRPEIIRCKDCKHYKITDNRAFGFPVKRCKWTGFEDVDDDDFCSRAKRRTDE